MEMEEETEEMGRWKERMMMRRSEGGIKTALSTSKSNQSQVRKEDPDDERLVPTRKNRDGLASSGCTVWDMHM